MNREYYLFSENKLKLQKRLGKVGLGVRKRFIKSHWFDTASLYYLDNDFPRCYGFNLMGLFDVMGLIHLNGFRSMKRTFYGLVRVNEEEWEENETD